MATHEHTDDEDDPLVGVAAGAVTALTLAVAFGLMFLGVEFFWVAFPVGFGGGIPLAVSLAKWYESNRAGGHGRASRPATRRDDETDDALAELRDRYARGDLDDAAFERRVERLLETESVDDAEAFLTGETGDRGAREDTALAEERDGETVERA